MEHRDDGNYTLDEQHPAQNIDWLENAAKFFEDGEKWTATLWIAESFQMRAKAIRAAIQEIQHLRAL